MSSWSGFRGGMPIEVGDVTYEVASIFGLKEPGHSAALVRGPQSPTLLWSTAPGSEWAARVERIFDRTLEPALPRWIARPERETSVLELDDGDWQLFDDTLWRAQPAERMQRALTELARALAFVHDQGMWFGSLRRRHLVMETHTGMLCVGAAPRLAPLDPTNVEQVWRDLRVIGELVYEHRFRENHPGPHEMASMLRDPDDLVDRGFIAPALMQVVAGCVTPYGELAYTSAQELVAGLDLLADELHVSPRVEVATRSTMGAYIFRKNNQDSCAHVLFDHHSSSRSRQCGFFCVADGIGGIQDGERASALAARAGCEAFARAWAGHDFSEIERSPVLFARGIAKITSQRLALAGELHPEGNRGGTTFSSLVLAGRRAGIAHVGDSRVTLVRDGRVIPLTRDHTLRSILERLGDAPAPGTPAHASSGRTIARFMSTGFELELERIDGPDESCAPALGLTPEALERDGFAVAAGDLFILTSDGAHEAWDDAALLALTREHADVDALASALERVALEFKTRDNVTVMVVAIR